MRTGSIFSRPSTIYPPIALMFLYSRFYISLISISTFWPDVNNDETELLMTKFVILIPNILYDVFIMDKEWLRNILLPISLYTNIFLINSNVESFAKIDLFYKTGGFFSTLIESFFTYLGFISSLLLRIGV